MIWIKRLLIFSLLVVAIVATAKVVPHLISQFNKTGILKQFKGLNSKTQKQTDTLPKAILPKDSQALPTLTSKTPEKPILHWKDALIDSFLTHYSLDTTIISKKSESFWKVYLSKGIPLAQYSLTLNQIAKHLRLSQVRGITVKSKTPKIIFSVKKGSDSLQLLFRYGKSYKKGSAQLALVWILKDSIGSKEFSTLTFTKWKKTFIIRSTFRYAKQLSSFTPNNEYFSFLPMEPFEYPYHNPGKGTLLIHHSQSKIHDLLKEKIEKFSHLSGFATKIGSRAIENKQLLTWVISYTQDHQLYFLDLTGSRRSLSRQTCWELSAPCYQSKITDKRHLTELLNKKAKSAQRYGEAVLVLPYSKKNFHTVKTFFKENNLSKKGIEIVKLSDIN